jgi:hypothetical protein
MIFLDTSVLSHVFRRSKSVSPSEVVTRFTALVEQDSPLLLESTSTM